MSDVICVSTIKHSVFRKIHLSSVTKHLHFYRQPAKNPINVCTYMWPKTKIGAELAQKLRPALD